jgi:hypothetical protein
MLYCDTNITIPNKKSRDKRREMHSRDYSTSSGSAGAQSTQRPVAFPVATRSTMLGCEHVTACAAVTLFTL